jgi:hypothetical protein
MLYDPKWQPLSLANLIAWLEKQPPDRRYRYTKPRSCLVAQWLKATGAQEYVLHSHEVSTLFGGLGDFIVMEEARTFGAALQRARASVSADAP